MADNNPWKTVSGFVQWEPKDGEAAGKKVRWATIRQTGSRGSLIRLTVWPSHKDVEINEGDLLYAEGPFTTREVEGDDGNVRKYLNLSAQNLVRFAGNKGKKADVDNAGSSDGSDSDDDYDF